MRVKGDRIVLLSRSGIPRSQAAAVIDASGLIVAPGFVDNHAHIETSIRDYPLAENFLRQGITTILASLHSKDQPWPLDRFMASLEMAPNVGFFAGHTWIRKQVMGMENRDPSAAEMDRMRWMVEESMKAGALGLSTGLLYVPANYSKTEEVIELAKVAARYGGLYVSHMRNESGNVLESVAEVIRIAEEAQIPAQTFETGL